MANAVEVFKQNMVKGRRLASKIEHLAHHDALTDLPNRVLFHEKLEQALRYARRGRLLALHFLDLDQFKAVNDTLGHHIGDRLLQAVAERLLDGLRETDAVARLGGDEFAILQTAIESPLDAIGFAERVIEMFAKPFEVARTSDYRRRQYRHSIRTAGRTGSRSVVEMCRPGPVSVQV